MVVKILNRDYANQLMLLCVVVTCDVVVIITMSRRR